MHDISAEIISIGNELLAGYTINTNAAYISQQLKDIGINVKWVTTIEDEPDEIMSALNTAYKRANVVLTTGGLGPTPDDITKNSICDFFNTKLEENAEVLEDLKAFLKVRNRPLSFLEMNRAQALVPAGCQIIRNPIGTAPGIILEKNGVWFSFMPGVPREMKKMIQPHFINFLKSTFKTTEIKTEILRTTGIPESTLNELLKEEIAAHPQFPFAFLPKQIGVDLRFRLNVHNEELYNQWQNFINMIAQKAAKYIFTRDERSMAQVIVELLAPKKLNLAVAESFTGGLLSDWITNIPGSSAVFEGTAVTYSNASKSDLLGVKKNTLQSFGAVSEETVLEMVRGVQKKFKSECAIATTGIAGPGGATETKAVGYCFIAARYKETEAVKSFNFGTERHINKMRGSMAGLEMLRRLLIQKS